MGYRRDICDAMVWTEQQPFGPEWSGFCGSGWNKRAGFQIANSTPDFLAAGGDFMVPYQPGGTGYNVKRRRIFTGAKGWIDLNEVNQCPEWFYEGNKTNLSSYNATLTTLSPIMRRGNQNSPSDIVNYSWLIAVLEYTYTTGGLNPTPPNVQTKPVSSGSWASIPRIKDGTRSSDGDLWMRLTLHHDVSTSRSASSRSIRVSQSGSPVAQNYSIMACPMLPHSYPPPDVNIVANVNVDNGGFSHQTPATLPLGHGYRTLELHLVTNHPSSANMGLASVSSSPANVWGTPLTQIRSLNGRSCVGWRYWDDWRVAANESWTVTQTTTGGNPNQNVVGSWYISWPT